MYHPIRILTYQSHFHFPFFSAAILTEKIISPSLVLGQSMAPTLNKDISSLTPDIIAVTRYDRFDVVAGDVSVCPS